MVGFFATREGPGSQWVNWSELGWPRLVDTPPKRQPTWLARSAPKAPPTVAITTTVESPSQGDGPSDGGDGEEETAPATALPEEGNHTMNNSSSLVADFIVDTIVSAGDSPAGVEVAAPAAEPDSAVEGSPEAAPAEDSAPLADPAASQNDAELPQKEQQEPQHAEEGEKTPERTPSVQEENPPTQTEDRAPSPAEPTEPKEDDAKSVSSTPSEHVVHPPSDVAKGKRRCSEVAYAEEETPFLFYHQRSFPLVRQTSRSSVVNPPRTDPKSHLLAMMGYEEGQSSRPPRSVLEALGLRESEWDESVLVAQLPPVLPSELLPVVTGDVPNGAAVPPEPVANVRRPVVIPLTPPGEETDHVYDLPTRRNTRSGCIRTPPTMSGALPVPAGWQPEPVATPRPEAPKIRWSSRLLRKLRNFALPRPVLQLLLGREIADQAKAALELYANGAA